MNSSSSTSAQPTPRRSSTSVAAGPRTARTLPATKPPSSSSIERVSGGFEGGDLEAKARPVVAPIRTPIQALVTTEAGAAGAIAGIGVEANAQINATNAASYLLERRSGSCCGRGC